MMRFLSVFAAIAACLLPSAVHGDVITNVTEVGGNVRFDYSGSLDLSGLAFTTGATAAFAGITTNSAFVNGFAAGSGGRFYTSPFSARAPGWHPGRHISASANGGDHFYIASFSASPLRLHASEFTGDVWSGSGFVQFDNTTLAALRIDLSSDAVWTIDNANADTITITTNAATAVPEPSSFALLGLGGIGFLVRRRRKSRADARAESYCATSEC